MRSEYDFSKAKGVRGKYYRAMRQGYSITIHHTDGTKEVRKFGPEKDTVALEPDVREYFPDAQAVNNALRSLIALIPTKKRTAGKAASHVRNKSTSRQSRSGARLDQRRVG